MLSRLTMVFAQPALELPMFPIWIAVTMDRMATKYYCITFTYQFIDVLEQYTDKYPAHQMS
jgi:hypothetical protein